MRRLLIRPGAIGDFLVSLPALESLSADYTEVWTATQNLPLARFADRARSLQDTGLDWLELPGASAPPALARSLREFDSIVSWYGSAREEFRSSVAALGLPFAFLPALPGRGTVHATDFYLEQALRLGGRPVDPVARLSCESAGGDYVVIHPFSGSPAKNWPLTCFERVAGRLEPRHAVEWSAGPEEDLARARRFDDLYQLAAWLAGARLYIGNDSGISHLAAAVGTPALVLFGPTDARVWAPRGRTVRLITTARRDEPIASIRVDDVADAAATLLAT
jgi:ADP-heptose:LPS heptosyltransferase